MRLALIVASVLVPLGIMPVIAKTQLGPGDVTCATFLGAKDAAAVRSYRDWILGFLSAINETMPGPNLLRDGREADYLDRVDSACRSRPGEPLSEAILDLQTELSKEVVDSSDPRVEIPSGFQQTFAASEASKPALQRPRRSPIGPTDPTGPGEITIGLAPAGGAVGCAKLHVFERTTSAVRFSAIALRGRQAIATEKLCGRLDTDTWTCLPPETTSVRVFGAVPAENGCR